MLKLDEIEANWEQITDGLWLADSIIEAYVTDVALLIRAVRVFGDRYWDVRLAHEDPEDNDYNGCDNGLCGWCEIDPDVLELLEE